MWARSHKLSYVVTCLLSLFHDIVWRSLVVVPLTLVLTSLQGYGYGGYGGYGGGGGYTEDYNYSDDDDDDDDDDDEESDEEDEDAKD